jgi:quinol monooxygenase YgiN
MRCLEFSLVPALAAEHGSIQGLSMTCLRTLATLLIATTLGVVAPSSIAQGALPQGADTGSRLGLWVTLVAKPGKEEAVASFLLGGKAIVDSEPGTTTWYAVRLSPSRFAIFDTFADEAGRGAHLSGKVAAALMAQAPELLQQPPSIEKIEVLAVKSNVRK